MCVMSGLRRVKTWYNGFIIMQQSAGTLLHIELYALSQGLRVLRYIPINQLDAVDCGESTAHYV